MFLTILSHFITLLLYVLIFTSAGYLFRSQWKWILEFLRSRWLGISQRQKLRNAHIYNPALLGAPSFRETPFRFNTHIRSLIEATTPWTTTVNTVAYFAYFSSGFGAMVFLSVYLPTGHLVVGFLVGMVFTLVPYCVLIVRKHHATVKNSYEIVHVTSLLLSKYRIARNNMLHGLQATVQELPRSSLRYSLSRLVTRLERYTSPTEALGFLRMFQQTVGTSWGSRLSMFIFEAVVNGTDLEASLLSLIDDMAQIQGALKDQSADRMDTVITGIFPLIGFVAALFFFQHSVTLHFFALQFATSQSTTLFFLALLFSVVAFVVAVIFIRPKQDL